MSTSNEFLVIALLLLTINGFVGYLIMSKARRYVASKAALTTLICFFLGITIMRRLLLPNDAIFIWSEVVWCMFIFIFVFFAIRGVLVSTPPNK
jgi:glycerol-3-phosphate acyltransferase PlsY